MFCPACRCEFRPGFDRCETCDEQLVETLAPARQGIPPPAPMLAAKPASMAEYCGFFSLAEARDARDELRRANVRCDILIREAPNADLAGAVGEEYWLRVDSAAYERAAAVLGVHETPAAADDGSFTCGACGERVGAEETVCPACGARFDED